MKRFLLNVFILMLTVSVSYGQEYKKQIKSANKLLSKYYLDQIANKASLDEAVAMINTAFQSEDAMNSPEAWISKGQIFNEIAKTEMTKKILDDQMGKSGVLNTPDAGVIALQSFEKAMALAQKKSQTKDAIAGIKENEEVVNNLGIVYFQANDYDQAYKNFNAGVKDYEYLKKNGEKSRLDDQTARNDHYFYTSVAGYFGNEKQDVLPLLKELYAAKYTHPLVYEALFTLTVDQDEPKAMEYLETGKKVNPDESSLLFAEINHYLKVGKLDVLIGKLKAAIAKEPENVSVYTTLGNVYDQLNQRERASGNIAEADKYFDLAFDYYGQALAKNPNTFDAIYSQGALYYNKAAGMVDKLNELSNDYTPAGNKKYKALKDEMDGYFTKALPYFIKAEDVDPKDLNVKIALKEIYARQGELEKSQEYKKKIEQLGGGN
jgi:tetratricopeptide (TPR) repeat protein